MTIKQLAKELKVSPQAIYQRLQRSKVDVKSITHPVTKELTSDGEYVIRSMYVQENNQQLSENQPTQEEKKELEELRKQVKELIEKNSILEKRVEEVLKDKEAFKTGMERAQQMQEQMMARLLPAGEPEKKTESPETRRLSLRERITGRISSSSKG